MESDALSDLLTLFRVRASVYLHAHFCGDWAVDVADHKKIPFHVVGAGHCWLHLNGSESPIPLAAGDLVVFPHDMPHSLSELPERPGPLVPRNQPAGAKPTSTSFTTLVCGDFELERRFWNPLLDALPEVIVIPHDDTRNTARLRTLLDVIVFEASVEEPGGKAVIDKLAEAIFIHVIRVHLARDDLKTEGYVAALADRHIGRALQAIHRNPEFKWSVDRIAQIAGQSRSAFTERFHRT
ncbi:MAG: AraC family transcriptional regulator, partial [Proteobacteria bacterium]